MHTQFKGTNYDLPPEVTAYAGKKIQGLGKYLGAVKEAAHAYVDLGRETGEHHNGGRIWRADINLDVPGARFRAAALEESIEAAIDKVTDELAKEVKTARERQQSLVRRGGAAMKSFVQGLQG
ncbi:MAG: hypothetical protein JWN64_134 [Parcubacteria group bacterium]|nr:hypothetical protein [Parcubacteria group bacterium]